MRMVTPDDHCWKEFRQFEGPPSLAGRGPACCGISIMGWRSGPPGQARRRRCIDSMNEISPKPVSFPRPVNAWDNFAGPVAAAAVGAHPLPALKLDAHELTAARTVLHRTEADLDHFSNPGVVRRPAERNQLRRRTALEGPCRRIALVVDDGDVQPS